MQTALPDDFFSKWLPAICASGAAGAEGGSGYALPAASLDLLARIVAELDVREVFEFGSGASTAMFLAAGCQVTLVEDSRAFLDETVRGLPADSRTRLAARCQPLEVLFHRGAPFRGWRIGGELSAALAKARLVLVDSPAFPPFREHALMDALALSRGLVVIDDATIPTVRRFCTRLASRNNMRSYYSPLDHGLFFVEARAAGRQLDTRRG